jgi:hypothetical protein
MINGNTRFLVNEKGGVSIGSTTEGPAQGLFVNGNAGIGTAEPKTNLHVFRGSSGTLTPNANSPLIVENSTNSYISVLAPSTSEKGIIFGDNVRPVNGAILYNSSDNMLFQTEKVTRMILTASGNLGIGTTAPVAPLHVKATGTRVAAFDGPNGMYIEVNENAAARGYFGSLAGNFDIGTNSLNANGKLNLTIKAVPKMTIDASGKVGIGTTTPAVTLHVATGDDSKTEGGGFIVTGSESSQNISMDQNEIMARNAGKVSTLYLNHSGGNVVIDGTTSGSNVGIGTATPDYQLQLTRNSAAKPSSPYWTVASDQRLKKNIAEFTDGLNVIKQIHPVWYNYTGEAGMPAAERSVGTLAQELQKAAPYMVKEWVYQKDETSAKANYLSVDYNALLFMFVNAFKEQQEEINSQDKKIEALTKLVNQLMQNRSVTKDNAAGSTLSNINARLEQNAPNPFNSSTTIRYQMPASVSNSQIMVTNANGNMIKTFTLINKGAGSVTIKAGELAAGSYYYTLIVDGKKVDSKKMVLIK